MQIQAPFELILFGGLGDLAQRKLLPALYLLMRDGRLPDGKIISITRKEMPREEFLSTVRSALRAYVSSEYLEESAWAEYSSRLSCVALDLGVPEQYQIGRASCRERG